MKEKTEKKEKKMKTLAKNIVVLSLSAGAIAAFCLGGSAIAIILIALVGLVVL